MPETEIGSVDHRSLDAETLFARFFEETTGEALLDEERAIFREVLEGLGRETSL